MDSFNSTALFNRIVRLTIGKAGQEGIKFTQNERFLSPRIQFDVVKTNGAEPNTAKITITNANKTILDALPPGTEFAGETVILEAGYLNGGFELLYVGAIVNLEIHAQKPDNDILINANDGYDALKGKLFGKSYVKQTKKAQVLDDAIKSTGLPTDGVNFLADMGMEAFNGGFTASGPVTKTLDDATKALKLKWSIQDGKIVVIPDAAPSGTELVMARFLTAESGMIGAPEKIIDPDHGVGYRVRSLLLPSVTPNGMVSITDLGYFRVYKISSRGDTHGNDFTSEVLAFSR